MAKSTRQRVKGYTRADGIRVKGYLRKRVGVVGVASEITADIKLEKPHSHKDGPIHVKRYPADPTSRTKIKSIELAVFRPKGEAEYASETALESAKREIKRILRGRAKPRDNNSEWQSVWRDSVDLKDGTTVAALAKALPNARDVNLEGGRIHIGLTLKYGGKLVYVPISHAYDSMAEAGINAGFNVLAMILKYLPDVATDDDEDE